MMVSLTGNVMSLNCKPPRIAEQNIYKYDIKQNNLYVHVGCHRFRVVVLIIKRSKIYI